MARRGHGFRRSGELVRVLSGVRTQCRIRLGRMGKLSIGKEASQALISYREAMKYPNELGLCEFVENIVLRKIYMTKSDESKKWGYYF